MGLKKMMLSKRALKYIIYNSIPKNLRGRKISGHRFIIRYKNNKKIKIILNKLNIKELFSLYKSLYKNGEVNRILPTDQL